MSLPTMTGKRLLVNLPLYIYAVWLNETDLFVYRSPLVRDSSPQFAPVREQLEQPHYILSSEVIEDEGMMGYKAHLTTYRIGETH